MANVVNTVSGDSIYTILRIDGVATHQLWLHPSLLSGPFKIDDQAYDVKHREVVKRGVPQRPDEIVDLKQLGPDGAEFTVPIVARHINLPDWVVTLDLKAVPA